MLQLRLTTPQRESTEETSSNKRASKQPYTNNDSYHPCSAALQLTSSPAFQLSTSAASQLSRTPPLQLSSSPALQLSYSPTRQLSCSPALKPSSLPDTDTDMDHTALGHLDGPEVRAPHLLEPLLRPASGSATSTGTVCRGQPNTAAPTPKAATKQPKHSKSSLPLKSCLSIPLTL